MTPDTDLQQALFDRIAAAVSPQPGAPPSQEHRAAAAVAAVKVAAYILTLTTHALAEHDATREERYADARIISTAGINAMMDAQKALFRRLQRAGR